jgi:tetratricopeptide (TPR) repeat protein
LRILPLIAAISLFAAGCAHARAVATVTHDSDDVDSVFADYLSARFAASHHDLGEAAKYYMASLNADPTNTQLQTLAFFYSAIAGDVEQAGKIAKSLTASDTDARAARLTLAVIALKHHDFKAARLQIAQSSKEPVPSFTAALIDAWAAAGEGDQKTATADAQSLHAQHIADGPAYFNEAMIAEMFGQNDVADSDYRQALQISGPMPRVVEAYGRFLERNGRTDDARALYTKLSTDEGFASIVGPGLMRLATGVKPQPMVTTPEDGAAEALFDIAASFNDESSRDASILYLRLALYLRPKLNLATILLADRFESLGKYDDAIKAYQNIGQDSPYYRLAAVEVAVDKARLNRTDESIADLKALSTQFPSDIELWTALGDAYRQAGKFPDATKAYDKAIESAGPPVKKNWPLYYARAIAEQQSKNWPAAEADLKQALALNPNEPQVLNYLGYSWVDQKKNIPQALTMLEKARSLAPQDGYIVDSVGWAYFELGRYDDAAKTLEDAVQLVPGDPTINDHLGDAYWKIGRKLDARFQWNHALAFGAEADEKAKIEQKLQVGLDRDDRS